MAKFLRHESCKNCGSRDNLGRYSDGSAFCFGCHYTERGTHAPWVEERADNQQCEQLLTLRGGRHLPELPVRWLLQYDIQPSEWLHANFRWDSDTEQLLIPLYDSTNTLCCIQAKNFNPQRARKAKYFNIGEKSLARTTFFNRGTSEYNSGCVECSGTSLSTPDTSKDCSDSGLCLTEDVLSAIKVGRVVRGMPLLGTSISLSTLAELAASYTHFYVWLDYDKWRESRQIADALKMLGRSTTSILTEKDPKEYSNEEIRTILARGSQEAP